MDDQFEDELGRALDGALPKAEAAREVAMPRVSPLRAVREAPVAASAGTVAENWEKIEGVLRKLYDRLRRDRLTIIEDHDREWTSISADYERKVSEETTRLLRERDAARTALTATTTAKLRENEDLGKRIAAGGGA